MDEPRHGGRLPDPGMGAICGRCGEPRLAHGGPSHLGACPGESGIQAKRFSIAPEDRPQPEQVEEHGRLPLPPRAVTGMDELVAYLRRALDEDERVAREADSGRWLPEDKGITFEYRADDFHGGEAQARLVADTRANQRHIANWDPARVLAEVEAKRRILDCLTSPTGELIGWMVYGGGKAQVDAAYLAKLLAQPYAGGEGWREEWRTAG
jgi:hypothetical protein